MAALHLRPAWVEVDLDSLAFNVSQIRQWVGKNVKIMAMVKGDAYGVGITGVIDTLTGQGIDMFGAGILDEALLIRQKTQLPVLILGYTPFEYSDVLVEHDLMQTVYCKEQAMALNEAACKLNKKARIHVEMDTGMGRLGFFPDEESQETIAQIAGLPNLELAGIFTHLPYTNESSEEGVRFTETQFQRFGAFIGKLQQRGVDIPLKHVCNSQGTVHYRQMHLDMVRAGILLYGSYPSFQAVLPLKPVLSLKTRVGFIKKLGPGENVSYGRTYTTAKETTVATLPLGYGDGYNRLLTNRGEVLIQGKRVPLIGTICMDQCMADITNLDGSSFIGDEVVLLGKQGNEEITIEEIAEKICGFINYEYLVTIQSRVPRVYKKNGTILQVVNRLLN